MAPINIDGTWKDGSLLANIGGTWKEGDLFANVGGTWKEVLPSTGVYELIADITVGTATTSVSFTGLSLDKDSEYLLVDTIVNPINYEMPYYIYFNNNVANTNYYTQAISAGGTSVSGLRVNTPRVGTVYNNCASFHSCKIKLTNNNIVCWQSSEIYDYNAPTSMFLQNWFGSSIFTVTSVTSISIQGGQTNSIGAGSRFQLYKIGGC